MRKLTITGLVALGLTWLVLPSTASAAVFSLAPAISAAGDQSLQQATPIDEARTRRRRRVRARR